MDDWYSLVDVAYITQWDRVGASAFLKEYSITLVFIRIQKAPLKLHFNICHSDDVKVPYQLSYEVATKPAIPKQVSPQMPAVSIGLQMGNTAATATPPPGQIPYRPHLQQPGAYMPAFPGATSMNHFNHRCVYARARGRCVF